MKPLLLSPPSLEFLVASGFKEYTNKSQSSVDRSDKMDSLKSVASKVKHSPQVIRKTFASSQKSYCKVTEGEKSKGKTLLMLTARHPVI